MIPQNENEKREKNGLYLVSTPIGNLKDITVRAIEILKKSDLILCEDTRISKNLLNYYNIRKSTISNHKFNENYNLKKIISELEKKKIISLISDAGTPAISDPGRLLINECINKNIDVFPIPGPSSITSSLSISGFSSRCFFYGFLKENKTELEKNLSDLSEINSSIIFFIPPKKMNNSIPLLKKFFSDRKILICREMTKYHEQFIRCSVKDLKNYKESLKGEITVVLSERLIDNKKKSELDEVDKMYIKKMIKLFKIKDIIKIFTNKKNIKKNDIYNYFLSIKR